MKGGKKNELNSIPTSPTTGLRQVSNSVEQVVLRAMFQPMNALQTFHDMLT